MSNIAIAAPADRIFSGILLTSVAYALFAGQDAAIKLLVAGVSVWQVLFFRSVVVLAGCVAFGGPSVMRDAVRSPIVGAMLLRSFFILGAWLCYYSAAKHLQLAELTTIYFAAPVIITVLSIFLLGETVPLGRWIAVALGFVGVFVACDPAGLGFTIPVLLVLAAAVLWAFSIVLIRKTALRERTVVQILLNNAFFLVMAGVPMTLYWVTPSPSELALLVAVGGLGGFAQFTLFEGMKRAPASVIASFEYTSLVWSFALGYLIWSDIPRPEVFVGAAMIIAAGFVMIAGERARQRR
ncbi:MAG: DMT family transporter [Rhizobiaceae bacterium]|nr:DMT family transporter [Rhizobiaceae bacterium]